MSNARMLVVIIAVGLLAGLGLYIFQQFHVNTLRNLDVRAFLQDPSAHPAWIIQAGTRCGEAPFLFPTTGMIGYLWGDTFQVGHRHQGLDIFAGTDIDVTGVVAVSAGYLTRLASWKSAVILRIPHDPLQPNRQIWVYYAHMANPNGNSFISDAFPPGTTEKYVEAGTLLGYQGDYSGDPNNPVGVHLHISIVQDDGSGHFKNELDINNTYDPTPYFNMPLNADKNPDKVPVCEANAK